MIDTRGISNDDLVKHFKGNMYKVICIAEHTETQESLVVYRAMYSPYKVYARPAKMFFSRVDKKKYPDSTQVYRFEKV